MSEIKNTRKRKLADTNIKDEDTNKTSKYDDDDDEEITLQNEVEYLKKKLNDLNEKIDDLNKKKREVILIDKKINISIIIDELVNSEKNRTREEIKNDLLVYIKEINNDKNKDLEENILFKKQTARMSTGHVGFKSKMKYALQKAYNQEN